MGEIEIAIFELIYGYCTCVIDTLFAFIKQFTL